MKPVTLDPEPSTSPSGVEIGGGGSPPIEQLDENVASPTLSTTTDMNPTQVGPPPAPTVVLVVVVVVLAPPAPVVLVLVVVSAPTPVAELVVVAPLIVLAESTTTLPPHAARMEGRSTRWSGGARMVCSPYGLPRAGDNAGRRVIATPRRRGPDRGAAG
jgi:hypothetical protein